MMDHNAKASVADEPGCREFNVYEIGATPNHLFLYEVYDDEAARKKAEEDKVKLSCLLHCFRQSALCLFNSFCRIEREQNK